MMEFELCKNGRCAAFVLEEAAYSGVKKIAQKVCRDVELVTGKLPALAVVADTDAAGLFSEAGAGFVVLAATIGHSSLLEELEQKGRIDLTAIRGKRECFSFLPVEAEGGVRLLVIAGSDKRGTIYGLFHISERMGVSPWVTFSGVLPQRRKNICFSRKDAYVSKEPSVKYRGFFINDEWPAFGNWTFEHFGGFTAGMYDIIFETLLRLKGNYLWPAMWTSSFTLDGPGEANAALADEYGVVMSNSHHEPCLRHSEEWDLVRGEDSVYGNEWNYYTNRDGLLRYWRDGLLRSGKYENIITIGMRGERDSSMLGPDASLKQNIDLLKDIITQQRRLIAECVGQDGREVPQMIALYKEVEAYFYGNEGKHDGLRDWDGLDGVTFMLCEDNFGNMRTLPTADLKDRDGGWGMYYHFDYHGGPISYEWVNSSYLPKVWEQMTKAYEFGIRDIWIVNVGDLMFQEYPLSFFMDLAYDYERWGITNLAAPVQYPAHWVKREFGGWLSEADQKRLVRVMEGYTKRSHNCKPEAMGVHTYHPLLEAEDELSDIARLEKELLRLKERIPGKAEGFFYVLVYYPAMGSLNVQKWNLYGGLNHCYADIGALLANDCAARMEECRMFDERLTKKFHSLQGGRWNGMGLSKHVGFVNWNDEDCRYPVRRIVEPADGVRMFAYAKGEADVITSGGAWTGKPIVMRGFLRPDASEGTLVLLGAGRLAAEYRVECADERLSFSKTAGTLRKREEITVRMDAERMSDHCGDACFTVVYGGGRIRVEVPCRSKEELPADAMTFVEYGGLVAIEAEHFAENTPCRDGCFKVVPTYGKTLSAMKVFPVDREFSLQCAPALTYKLWVQHPGSYRFLLYAAPVNPHRADGDVQCAVKVNGEEPVTVSLIPDNYRAGEPSCPSWCRMVLEQIRIVTADITLAAGMNTVELFALSPGVLPEKLVFVKEGRELPKTCLGAKETYYIK